MFVHAVLVALSALSLSGFGSSPKEAAPVTLKDVVDSVGAETESVDKALELVPKALFSRYMLMHTSESQQSASNKRPRVILWGGGGDLLLAYGGDGETLEAIEFDRKTRSWNFSQGTFGPSGVVWKKNPDSCKRCHGEPPAPIWEPYKHWPGAYPDHTFGPSKQERAEIADLAKRAPKESRYRHLEKLDGYFGKSREEPSVFAAEKFTDLVNSRHGEVLAARVFGNPAFQALRPALKAVENECFGWNDRKKDFDLTYLPPDSELKRAVTAILKKRMALRKGSGYPDASEHLFALLEGAGLGISARKSTLIKNIDAFDKELSTPDSRSYLASGLGPAATDVFFASLRGLERKEKPLAWRGPGYGGIPKWSDGEDCRDLVAASQKALAGYDPKTTPKPKANHRSGDGKENR